MKYKIFVIGFLCLHLSSPHAICETIEYIVQFAGQWPYHSTKAIAVDPDRNIVLMGKGDKVCLLDSDLNLISLYTVTQSGQVGGIFFNTENQLIFAACKNDGLQIVDSTDTANPFIAGAFLLEGSTVEFNSVYVTGQNAFIAGGVSGFHIINIAEPKNPSLISSTNIPGAFGISYSIDVFVLRDYAWIADLYNGVHTIDIGDIIEPDLLNLITLPGARDLTIEGNFLYAALEGNGIEIIDVSDPGEPKESSLYLADGIEKSVRIDGNYAYVAYGSFGLKIVDVTDKTSPAHPQDWTYTNSGAVSINLFQGKDELYITNENTGMQKLDISNKSNISPITAFDTPADAIALDVKSNTIFTLDDNVGNSPEKEGLRIYQISVTGEVIQFFLKGFCSTPGKANALSITGEYAYIADGNQGLQIINISDKTSPEIINSYDTTGYTEDIIIESNDAYLADGNQGVSIINIADPANPKLISTYSTLGYAKDIFVSQSYAYVINENQGLQILDISNKTNLFQLGAYDTSGAAESVLVEDNYAYIADGDAGLVIIDIEDKTNPKFVSSYNTDGYAKKLSVAGIYLYIADGENGVCVINISNPLTPVKQNGWSYNSFGIASDIYAGYSFGDELFAFIADGPSGVIAINLSVEKSGENNTQNLVGNSKSGCFIQDIFK